MSEITSTNTMHNDGEARPQVETAQMLQNKLRHLQGGKAKTQAEQPYLDTAERVDSNIAMFGNQPPLEQQRTLKQHVPYSQQPTAYAPKGTAKRENSQTLRQGKYSTVDTNDSTKDLDGTHRNRSLAQANEYGNSSNPALRQRTSSRQASRGRSRGRPGQPEIEDQIQRRVNNALTQNQEQTIQKHFEKMKRDIIDQLKGNTNQNQ